MSEEALEWRIRRGDGIACSEWRSVGVSEEAMDSLSWCGDGIVVSGDGLACPQWQLKRRKIVTMVWGVLSGNGMAERKGQGHESDDKDSRASSMRM